MQRFINNWTTVLTEPLAVDDTLVFVPAADAARLDGLASDDHYVLTLVQHDASGAEIAWEIVRVTARAGGALSVARGQEGTSALALDVGAQISARLTAGSLSAGALLDKSDLAYQLQSGCLGVMTPIIAFSNPAVGAYVELMPSDFAVAMSADITSTRYVRGGLTYQAAPGCAIHSDPSGSAEYPALQLIAAPGAALQLSVEALASISPDAVSSVFGSFEFELTRLSGYYLELQVAAPALGYVGVACRSGLANWVVFYVGATGHVEFATDFPVRLGWSGIYVVASGAEVTIQLHDSAGVAALATLPLASLDGPAAGLSVSVGLGEEDGAESVSVAVNTLKALVTLA